MQNIDKKKEKKEKVNATKMGPRKSKQKKRLRGCSQFGLRCSLRLCSSSTKQPKGQRQRRGGSVFIRSTSQITLQTIQPQKSVKSCLRVATLEESLRQTIRNAVRRSLLGRTLSKPPPQQSTSPVVSKKSVKKGLPTRTKPRLSGSDEPLDKEHQPRLERVKELTAYVGQESGTTQHFSAANVLDENDDDDKSIDTVRPTGQVTFTGIELREYETIVTDNPGVSRGAAIGIGWKYTQMETVSVDDYEKYLPQRRTMKEIKLTTRERMQRLAESGYTQREIQQMTKQVNIAKRKRRATLERMHLHSVHEKLSHWMSVILKASKVRKGDDHEEDSLWDSAQELSVH